MIATVYKRLLQIGKVAGTLTFLFGIPYGIFQYIEAKDDGRIKQTLELFKHFNSSPYTDYRRNVLNALAENKSKIADAAKNPQALRDVVLGVVDAKKIETDLLLLMDFFDGVAVCVVTELCDADTTEKLFSGRAREIYVNFLDYIDVHRQTIAGAKFGIGLQTIAQTRPKKSGWRVWLPWN